MKYLSIFVLLFFLLSCESSGSRGALSDKIGRDSKGRPLYIPPEIDERNEK